MKYLLSKASLSVVKQLAEERTLCAFDFDGTLASIVPHPEHAHMRAETENLLRRLAFLYPCIVVSGRARKDILGKLQGVKVARVIGSHGGDTKNSPDAYRMVMRWKKYLEEKMGAISGLWIEDKEDCLAVHYRQATHKAKARQQILAVAQKLKQAHVFGGKYVVNIVAEDAPNKGDALLLERDRLRCDWVLYVGDDENDEAAFALQGNIVAVRIGRKKDSHARYYLRAQQEIDELIELLIQMRHHSAC
jgi:trehalose 6-phosphate phosphatase